MELIDVLRKQAIDIIMQHQGLHRLHLKQTATQKKSAYNEAEIMGLPIDVSGQHNLQVTDTTDPNFGAFYYMPDYDDPDGGQIIR